MSHCCYTFVYTFFISKIMNHETGLLPLTRKSFLEKLTLNFVMFVFRLQTANFWILRTISSEVDGPRNIYFLGLEIDRKTECSIFNWKFLKVLVLWVTASQQVNLSTIKKINFEGKYLQRNSFVVKLQAYLQLY